MVKPVVKLGINYWLLSETKKKKNFKQFMHFLINRKLLGFQHDNSSGIVQSFFNKIDFIE